MTTVDCEHMKDIQGSTRNRAFEKCVYRGSRECIMCLNEQVVVFLKVTLQYLFLNGFTQGCTIAPQWYMLPLDFY